LPFTRTGAFWLRPEISLLNSKIGLLRDEARIDQKNKIAQRWARRWTRPLDLKDQRTKSADIFGAICPAPGKSAGLILPFCSPEIMSLHLTEVSLMVAPGRARSF
jgi:hypothetical protein